MIGVHMIRTVACYWFQDMYGVLGPPVKVRGSMLASGIIYLKNWNERSLSNTGLIAHFTKKNNIVRKPQYK
jgi:hypothetical protein